MIDRTKEQFHSTFSPETRAHTPPSEQEVNETNIEQALEQAERFIEAEKTPLRERFGIPSKKPKVAPAMYRDETIIRIEKILEDGLGDAYSRLTPVAKQEFKIKGEAVSIKIRELLKESNIKVKKIFQLILEWLKMLPGINRFFLEQEAKIKTDRIISLHKEGRF